MRKSWPLGRLACWFLSLIRLAIIIRLGKLDCMFIVRNSVAFAVIFGMKRWADGCYYFFIFNLVSHIRGSFIKRYEISASVSTLEPNITRNIEGFLEVHVIYRRPFLTSSKKKGRGKEEEKEEKRRRKEEEKKGGKEGERKEGGKREDRQRSNLCSKNWIFKTLFWWSCANFELSLLTYFVVYSRVIYRTVC